MVQANDANVERHPGALPTLSLASRDLSTVHLLDMPSQWNDVAHLDLADNRLELFPLRQLMTLPLHSLCVANNALTALESSIGLLTGLRKLDLSQNQLASVPRSLQTLLQLRELRLGNNKLQSLSTTVRSGVESAM